jgi:hypothetical protein
MEKNSQRAYLHELIVRQDAPSRQEVGEEVVGGLRGRRVPGRHAIRPLATISSIVTDIGLRLTPPVPHAASRSDSRCRGW